jgi:manganese/zinc/iron transport system permease protein
MSIHWGKKIVRLHRLWEVYLVEYFQMAKDRVHPSAEEMEHIITPEVEQQLAHLLRDPKFDPHHQPIPEAGSSHL